MSMPRKTFCQRPGQGMAFRDGLRWESGRTEKPPALAVGSCHKTTYSLLNHFLLIGEGEIHTISLRGNFTLYRLSKDGQYRNCNTKDSNLDSPAVSPYHYFLALPRRCCYTDS